MEDIKNYSLKELEKFLSEKRYPFFSSKQIFKWIYQKRKEDFSKMSDISKPMRAFLADNFYFSKLKLLEELTSCDGTKKFLFVLEDSSSIETVVIPEGQRNTLCVSTQVGCKFSCGFCLSGRAGFKRNLKVSEIINQYLEAEKLISPREITNIVFMGIGEPLDNFDNVIKSIEVLTSSFGIHFVKRRVSISTAGITAKIKELKSRNIGIKLSLSLHSADSDKRSKMMPINKKYPLAEVIEALKEFSHKGKFPVTLEYVLIKDFNSQREDALKLAKLAKSIDCKLNIIPYNQSQYFSWEAPSSKEIDIFKKILKAKNVLFTFRKPRGNDILAACGQLKSDFAVEESRENV